MISRDAAIALLERTPLFSIVEPADRQAIAEEMREATFEPGQVIFTRGDDGREVHLVKTGRVRLSILTAEGRELSFAHAEPGQIFGEIAMLDGQKRSADATAVGRTTTLTLSKAAFKRLLETRPAVADAVIRFLCARIRDADQQLEAIALYPIEARLARFFLASANQKKSGADRSGRIPVELEMSQSELALLIGASRPKVNTALSLLEAAGALTRADGKFLCDTGELGRIAGLDVD